MKLDVVTVAVPRNTIRNAIESLMSNLDRTGVELRWIVHLDWIEQLADTREDCLQVIEELKVHFDDAVVMASPKNIGQPESFLRCMREVDSDFIYWEDDKVCTAEFSAQVLLNGAGDHRSLQGYAGRPGHTSASFWRHRVAREICRSWPAEGLSGNLEDWTKALCRRHQFRAGRNLQCAIDIGVESLSERGIVRQRGTDGNPRYVTPDARIAIATFVSKESVHAFLRNVESWKWRLCVGAFNFTIYHDGVCVPLLRASNQVDPHWITPDTIPESQFPNLVAESLCEFVGVLSPYVSMTRVTTKFPFDVLTQNDLILWSQKPNVYCFARRQVMLDALQLQGKKENAEPLFSVLQRLTAKERFVDLHPRFLGFRLSNS